MLQKTERLNCADWLESEARDLNDIAKSLESQGRRPRRQERARAKADALQVAMRYLRSEGKRTHVWRHEL